MDIYESLEKPIVIDVVREPSGQLYVGYVDPKVHSFGQWSGLVKVQDAPESVRKSVHDFLSFWITD